MASWLLKCFNTINIKVYVAKETMSENLIAWEYDYREQSQDNNICCVNQGSKREERAVQYRKYDTRQCHFPDMVK